VTTANFFFDGGGGGIFALILGLFWIAFWAVMIAIVVRVVSTARRNASTGSEGLRILEERYARGEIDRDEFLERKRVLAEGS
jgi:putative membrane protein